MTDMTTEEQLVVITRVCTCPRLDEVYSELALVLRGVLSRGAERMRARDCPFHGTVTGFIEHLTHESPADVTFTLTLWAGAVPLVRFRPLTAAYHERFMRFSNMSAHAEATGRIDRWTLQTGDGAIVCGGAAGVPSYNYQPAVALDHDLVALGQLVRLGPMTLTVI